MVLVQLIGFLIFFSGFFLVAAIVLRISTKWKMPMLLGASLTISVAISLLLMVVILIEGWILRPVQPNREDIIGHYVIARSKWPGKNADWQYRIEWSDIRHRWDFADSTPRHHIVANGPTLYRGRFGHHYVFQSPLYGNVFFEKNNRSLSQVAHSSPPLP